MCVCVPQFACAPAFVNIVENIVRQGQIMFTSASAKKPKNNACHKYLYLFLILYSSTGGRHTRKRKGVCVSVSVCFLSIGLSADIHVSHSSMAVGLCSHPRWRKFKSRMFL